MRLSTINLALKEAIRIHNFQELGKHFGKGLRTGDLTEMREDKPSPGRHVHEWKKPLKKQ